MAPGEEHEGHGGDIARSASGQAVHALRDRRPRELYKTALDRERRVALPHQRDELVELASPARVPAPVTDDEQRRAGAFFDVTPVCRNSQVSHFSPPHSI